MQFGAGPSIEELMWAQDQLSRYSYKPGWKFSIVPGMDCVQLHVEFEALDSRGSGEVIPLSGKFQLFSVDCLHRDPDAAADFFLRDMERIICRAEMHESQEWLKRDGVMINDPHK